MKIAIIGISFKLPNDVNSFNDLYNVLSNKLDCIQEHPSERFDIENYYDKENKLGKMRTKRAGYTKNIYDFDAEFFRISPKEAKSMDPQQRKMLELVYECIEDSKIDVNDFKGSKTGVFVGSCSMEYFNSESEDAENCNEYSVTGGLLTLLSNRISYYYDLKGPSLTLDTACSSSGHALHLACQSITNGESEMCFVGGSNILLSPETFVGFSQATMLSPDGKCKTFDEKADGYVRGEGFVSLLIKPLDKAIKDNNKIYAVINKTGINQDGKTASITMPNPKSQMELLEELYDDIDLNNLLYIEAHGTGTVIGDYNETFSIGNILGKNKKDKLNIGSIKSNIGHLEAASGLASILKVCLIMQKKELLPNINFKTPSSRIDFENLNLNVVTEKVKINQDKIFIGINNFGFGGSNFHCILENYNNLSENKLINKINNNSLHLLAIHGSSEHSIDNNIIKWTNYSETDFIKYLYNQNKKPYLSQSKIFVIKDKNDFEDIIFNQKENRILYTKFSNKKLDPAFVFCGQGAQHINMGYDMCQTYPVFLQSIKRCDKLWRNLTGESFIEKNKLFLPEFKDIDKSNIKINEPIVAQPALFFYQISLFELYKSYGVLPTAVIGHSAGEVAAFYASGSISLEDCVKISYYRSIYQQKTHGHGNMIVINKSYQELEEIVDTNLLSKLELACINDKSSIVLAGSSEYIKELNIYLDSKQIFNRIIRGDCPFHSSFQDIIRDDILNNTKSIKFIQPEIELISSTLGEKITIDSYTSDYWWKNIRNRVLFYQAIKELNYIDIFVELGPHPVLTNNIDNVYPNINIFPSSNRKEDSSIVFMYTLANLWAAGNKLLLDNFGLLNNTHYPKIVWNHKKFTNIPLNSYNRRHKIKSMANVIQFSSKKYSYMMDHVIDDKFIFPTVGYFHIILKYFNNKKRVLLNNIQIKNMYVPKNDMIEFNWENKDNNLILKSLDNKVEYFNTQIIIDNEIKEIKKELDIDENNYNYRLNKEECYQLLKIKKFNFGDSMKSIEYALIKDDSCLLKLIDKENLEFDIDPILLDAGLLSGVIINGITNNFTYLPVSADEVEFYLQDKPCWVYAEIVETNIEYIMINVKFYDKDFIKVGHYINYKADNVSNYDTENNFYLNYQKLELLDNNCKNQVFIFGENKLNLEYKNINKLDSKIDTLIYQKNDSLEQLKNNINLIETNKNIKNIYFIIDNNHNGLQQGFIRSYINESNKKISIIVLSEDEINDKNLINNIVENNYNYKTEYYLDNNDVNSIKLERYNNDDLKYNKYYLNKKGKGLDNLNFYPITKNSIPDYDVIVKPNTAALNFKDLMVILDVVSNSSIGYEAAGTIIESKLNNFDVGDAVIVIKNKNGNTLSNNIYCKRDEIFIKPNNLTFSQASSIGIIFSTVYICLIDRVKIKKGDTVLIHSATGGIGQAAIQICQMLGANIIATAGNDEKRDKLRNKFNIRYVSNSREPEIFTKDILEFTNNKGVDVILNSLSGKSLKANFKIIKKGGTIIEIGKRDSIENNHINLNKFLDSITYTSVHFDRLFDSDPIYIKSIINKVLKLFNENKLKPIEIEEFHISEVKDAIKYMSRGLHMGKIIIRIDDWLPDKFCYPEKIFNSNLYYIITGGLGGLGIELVNWMNLHGASKFILTSRSGNISKRADRIIKNLRKKECIIIIAKVDITNYQELEEYFFNNNNLKYSIDGIFHLAGTTKDKLIKDLSNDDINYVIKPKVEGCKNLGKLFQNYSINYFVTFSSICESLFSKCESMCFV